MKMPQTRTARVVTASRQDDEMRLHMLACARSGESSGSIGRRLNKGTSFARVTIARIRDADLAESGEDSAQVLRHYPQVTS
ncbi:hypothetical protein [Paracoccus laeviglucosivorans]|uniref:Uncharacterized protein n=1 Tax=Paracoccus laeviglucosivorans TaxID=1197861 RepID=A0A521E649_9RHOB|nr:hypothetical protein [Paracoccus laeviglucosivorans]SMO79414.1 hypothetical protein SAMN06265221_11178 [Paracoccus laeviglucosivorans]